MKSAWRTTILVSGCALALLVLAVGTFWLTARMVAPVQTAAHQLPADLPFNPVRLRSKSGDTLSAWYLDAQGQCATLLLLHAVRGDKRTMLRRARFLSEVGYGVMLMDFRAHGASGGSHITFGDLERGDVSAALAFLAEQRPDRTVGVIGFSLGGVSALLSEDSQRFDALILEAVYTSFEKAVANRVRLHAGDLGPLGDALAWLVLRTLDLRYGIAADDLRPIDRIPEVDTPVLIIAGEEDRHTTPEDSRRLFEAALEPKKLWQVEGAGHVDFHRHAPAIYEERVLSFLAKHLPCP